MFGQKSYEISRLEKALKKAEESHYKIYERPTTVEQSGNENVVRTFNDEGKITEEISTYIEVDENGEPEEETRYKTEYVYHDNKTEEIEYSYFDESKIDYRTITFYGSDGREEKVEFYRGDNQKYFCVNTNYYDSQGRLDRIERDWGNEIEGELYSYEYENDSNQHPSKEIHTFSLYGEPCYEECVFSYDKNGRKISSVTWIRIWNLELKPVTRVDYFFDGNEENPLLEVEIKRPQHRDSNPQDEFDHKVGVTIYSSEKQNEHRSGTVARAQKNFNSLSPRQKNKFVRWAVDEVDSQLVNDLDTTSQINQIKFLFDKASPKEQKMTVNYVIEATGLTLCDGIQDGDEDKDL